MHNKYMEIGIALCVVLYLWHLYHLTRVVLRVKNSISAFVGPDWIWERELFQKFKAKGLRLSYRRFLLIMHGLEKEGVIERRESLPGPVDYDVETPKLGWYRVRS